MLLTMEMPCLFYYYNIEMYHHIVFFQSKIWKLREVISDESTSYYRSIWHRKENK